VSLIKECHTDLLYVLSLQEGFNSHQYVITVKYFVVFDGVFFQLSPKYFLFLCVSFNIYYTQIFSLTWRLVDFFH